MANPLPHEKELYEQIKNERITVTPDIWDLLYNRIGDDISAINLLCQYYLGAAQPIPIIEAKKILSYTHHIKDIVNKVTLTKKSEFPFPEFSDNIPLHPILREMFTHYIGNDVYVINLIVSDAMGPEPQPVSLESTKKILERTHLIRNFMDKLREVTLQEKGIPQAKDSADEKTKEPQKGKKELKKEELFFRIRRLLAQEFEIADEEKIKPESRFNEDLGLDSVDAIQVIMVLEAEFDFEIPDEDAEKIFTVGQAVDYILKKLNSRK
jgi:acyl carrier protein